METRPWEHYSMEELNGIVERQEAIIKSQPTLKAAAIKGLDKVKAEIASRAAKA